MKKSDLFRVGVRLMARDRSRLPTRIITIILSAFSFMLFALASTVFLYNKIDLYTRAFFYYTTEGYLQEEPVPFLRDHYPYTYFSFYNENEEETAAVRQQVLEETGKNYIYMVSTSYCTGDFLGRTEQEWWDSQNKWLESNRVRSVAGSDAALGELGFSLLAGHYPTERNQIALHVGAYELFQKYGYRDVTKIYTQTPPIDDESYSDPNMDWYAAWQRRYIYDLNEENDSNVDQPLFYFQEAAASEVPEEPITDMQDLIGKYLVGFRLLSDGQIVMEPLEIVGIVDSTREKVEYWLAEASVFSEEWIADCTTYYRMYAAPPANYGEAKRAVSLAYDYHMARITGTTQTRLSLTNMDYLFPPENGDDLINENYIAIIGCAAGAFFGIFALLLNGHLTTRSIEARQRQVGILRSLGAGRGQIRLIFLVDILFTATCVFLVALAGSLGMFYGLMYEWLLLPRFNVSLVQYTGWTVLILAALCYAVPLLCAVLPVHKFFKKSIVDCISGTAVPPKRRKSPHTAT